MGCGGSKVDDFRLVTLCKERKEFIKAASEHRYALAAAHVSYFQSLKVVGDALRKFVDEELVIGVGSSPSDSPVLTLPSDEGKEEKKRRTRKDDGSNNKGSSSSTSISHSVPTRSPEEEEEDSHLHLSSGSDSELDSSPGHLHMDDSPEMVVPPYYSYASPPTAWSSPPGVNSYAYYMEKTPTMPSVVYEDPRGYSANGQWPETSYGYSSYPQYGNENGGFFGFSMGSPPQRPDDNRRSSPTPPPAPPSPKVSAWDFLNPFDSYDNGYPGYYSQSRYGFGSTTSSPDSKEVREREGIPDLEEETEQEMMKEARKSKKLNEEMKKNSGEGTSRAVPSQYSEGAPRAVPSQYGEGTSRAVPSQKGEGVQPEQGKEIKSSPDTIVSKSSEEEYARKKGVTFEVDGASTVDVESSKPSSLTTLSAHGTRDLQEVVKEIRDEFETASGHGREVSVLLEVGKLPYQSSGGTVFKVIFSRILYLIEPFMSSSHPPSGWSVRVPSSTMKMAKAYGDPGKEFNVKPINLSSTLEKLYVWEKKLYKEVKDEERLRDIYEKKCKRLKVLDDRGAESNKIDATQASIKKLLAKINVNIRTIDAISSRIHKLRDEELQPQLTELIHGLIRMWKSMLKCHQKQFQAIMESKIRTLKANTGHRGDSSLRATFELEVELLNWCTHFNQWIDTQKSYVRSLNEWLVRCIHHEPEETPDGIIPFSPGRIGAPPVFIICNDWYQAMERISETGVADAMHDFALSLHQLWERQGEEQRQRIKAEYLLKDFEKRLRTFRMERGKMERDALSDKAESGVSPLDDLKVDLDSMRKRLEEERSRHKDAVKLVHDAASSSIQAGLIPIFEALENFTSDALKYHEQVRFENGGGS